MDPLRRLLELEELRRLKAAYFRFYDAQDWPRWLALFTEDATLHADYEVRSAATPEPPVMALIGREAIGDYAVAAGRGRRTVHHGHSPELDLASETEATGIWAMEDIIDYTDRRLHGHGHYHESYRKVDGAWRFAAIHLTRLRLTVTPIARDAVDPLLDDARAPEQAAPDL